MIDIVFLSYEETNAEQNWDRLVDRFPWAKRVHGVKGIKQAHVAAAKKARTAHLYIVDGDTVVLDHFDFSFSPPVGEEEMLHLWYARNPVNDLEYGYGGIKLFPRERVLLTESESPNVDYSTSVCPELKIHPEAASITAFNSDPLSAWRAGFRECAKLNSQVIPRDREQETLHRLEAWTTKGRDRPNGVHTIFGANAGVKFGNTTKSPSDAIPVNDFDWLKKVFMETEFGPS